MAPFGEMNEATSGWSGHGSNHIQIDSDLGDFLIGGTKPYRKSKDDLILKYYHSQPYYFTYYLNFKCHDYANHLASSPHIRD